EPAGRLGVRRGRLRLPVRRRARVRGRPRVAGSGRRGLPRGVHRGRLRDAADPVAIWRDLSERSGMLLAILVLISTSKGDIKVELNQKKAPVSVENFLKYVKDKHYDGTVFHRVIKG